jgi:ADP-heptose:LPS heptosyltransferase
LNPLASGRHILVIRFSAMGDVAMCVPIIRRVLEAYPDLRFTFVSQKAFAPLFQGIDRLRFFPADLKGDHRGFSGIWKLFKQLQFAGPFDGVADLHQVLRTGMLDTLFRLKGIPVSVIDKGRREKQAMTRRANKRMVPLPSTFSRYAGVFKQLGFPVDLDRGLTSNVGDPTSGHSKSVGRKRVGIAPFAKHPGKSWPAERMRRVVESLSNRDDIDIYLFGGGKSEVGILSGWANDIPGLHCLAGKYTLTEELHIISGLDLMVSMDSANMHLASMFGVPVVSVWGATHPHAGFLGWGQDPGNVIQSDIGCRPCSVFGNKPCYKGTYECMTSIEPEMVTKKILTNLSLD